MERQILADLITWRYSNSRKPLILKGARQVGKTWVLLEFAKKEFKNHIYLNFEKDPNLHEFFKGDFNPSRIINELSIYYRIDFNSKSDLIIMDEIQSCPRALTSLKYFNEEASEISICAAGSLLGLFHGDASFPVGKVTFLELYPMNFIEVITSLGYNKYVDFINSLNLNKNNAIPEAIHNELFNLWKTYLVIGGMPEVVKHFIENNKNKNYSTISLVRNIQEDLIETYTADIAKNSGRLKSLNIERLWRNVPEQISRVQNATVSKFKFKDSIPGIRGYEKLASPLDWLEKAGLILRSSIVEKSEIPLMAYRKEKVFKLFLLDIGLLGVMSGLSAQNIFEMNIGSYKGYLAENFVAQELKSNGINQLYSWINRTSEIEFLLQLEDEIVPIEVKSGSATHVKSLKVYYDKYKPKQSVIISAKNNLSISTNGVIKMPLYLTALLPKLLKEI